MNKNRTQRHYTENPLKEASVSTVQTKLPVLEQLAPRTPGQETLERSRHHLGSAQRRCHPVRNI